MFLYFNDNVAVGGGKNFRVTATVYKYSYDVVLEFRIIHALKEIFKF